MLWNSHLRKARGAELGSFLKSRRARISLEDGLPPGPRRRTPGLRRAEVAQLLCPRPKGWRTKWDGDMFKRVLVNEAAAGLRVHVDEYGNRLTVKSAWDGLIHERLNVILNDSQRGSFRGTAPKWLLSGIVRC
ncbi:hypothetical protein [Nocardia sp. NPDC051463]|uniref:hypothetical protein n=1 Tax=Nocardia sp. NPDC051463 TaxID=3154845 RepID=UPI00344181B4